MSTISERLILILKEKNLKPADLARILSKSKGNIANLLKGDIKPGSDFLELLAEKLEININWLLTGTGSMLIEAKPPGQNVYKIPFRKNIRASAGAGCYVYDELEIEYIDVYDNEVKRLNINIKESDFIEVSGDSMYPFLNDRDKILVDKSKTAVIDGKIYVIRESDRIIVKRIQKVPKGIKVISDNKEYSTYDLAEDYTICGQVLLLRRDLA